MRMKDMTHPFADTPVAPLSVNLLGILDRQHTALWVFDIDQCRVCWANAAALQVWQAASVEALCARDMGQDMSEGVAQRLRQYQSDFISHDAVFQEQWTLYPNGLPVQLSVCFSGYRLPDGRMGMLCEGRPAQQASLESLRSVEALLHTPVMIALYDEATGAPLYRNPAARTAARSHTEHLFEHFVDPKACSRLMDSVSRDASGMLTALVATTAGECWHEISARRCLDAATGKPAILVSEVDVSRVKESEARARFLAEHDPLTGLANRTQLMRQFAAMMTAADGANTAQIALVLIDLDHFKDVNDSFGHVAGDRILVEVAARLQRSIRPRDVLARLGGDEFLILCARDNLQAELARIHRNIRSVLSQPMVLDGNEIRMTATLGVSLHPDDGMDFETLFRNADLAMYAAKYSGRDALMFYQPHMRQALQERTRLETELRWALERHEFVPYYQPRVDVATGRVVGAEALVRWVHPTRGLLSPVEFIGVCEAMRFINALDQQMFEAVAKQQAQWAAAGLDLQVSINLSGAELEDPQLLPELAGALARTGCDPSRLQVEITESMLLSGDARVLQTMQGIRDLGMTIALDDFGTGYSNLAYLQRFPIQILKIDRTFIQGLDKDLPVTELIVNLCHLMKLEVVAEGVETRDQLEWITRHGVAQYQGHLFSKALPADQFAALVKQTSGG